MSFVPEIIRDKIIKGFCRENEIACSIYDEEYPDRLDKEYSFVRFINYETLVVIYELDSRQVRSAPRYIPGKSKSFFSSITRWKFRYLIFENNAHALMTLECDNKGDQAGVAIAIELALPQSSLHLAEHTIKLFDEFYIYKCKLWDGLAPEKSIMLDKSNLKITTL